LLVVVNIKRSNMKTFEIEVQEVLTRLINIEAKNKSDAILKAKEMYNNEEIVLDADDHLSTEFILIEDTFDTDSNK